MPQPKPKKRHRHESKIGIYVLLKQTPYLPMSVNFLIAERLFWIKDPIGSTYSPTVKNR